MQAQEQNEQEVSLDREAVLEEIRSLSKQSIRLAWILGPIAKTAKFREWGYKSFNVWVEDCISNPSDNSKYIISKRYAYTLRDIGSVFWNFRSEINKLFSDRKIGIELMRELSDRVRNGLDISLAMSFLLNGSPIPKSTEEKATSEAEGAEKPVGVKSYVKAGDLDNFNLALILYAIFNGCKSENDALNEIVLSQLPELLVNFGDNDKLQKYKELIIEGRFRCAQCHLITSDPTFHHLYPQSLHTGHGPQALVDWPCHDSLQPTWEDWARKTFGDTNFEECLADLRAGKYEKWDSLIITGSKGKSVVIS